MELISGIWLLDILNILKYEGVDIFDSIVRVDAGIWGVLIIATIVLYVGIGLLTAMYD